MEIPANLDLLYSKTARREVRVWAALIIGAGLTWVSFQVDPQLNCDGTGSCNSWVVYIARAMGGFFALSGISLLIGNHPRGSGIDKATGELVWWYGRAEGLHRHLLSNISRIRIDLDSESADEIHIFDKAGDRIAFQGSEAVPWPTEDWAKRIIERYPNIELDVQR